MKTNQNGIYLDLLKDALEVNQEELAKEEKRSYESMDIFKPLFRNPTFNHKIFSVENFIAMFPPHTSVYYRNGFEIKSGYIAPHIHDPTLKVEYQINENKEVSIRFIDIGVYQDYEEYKEGIMDYPGIVYLTFEELKLHDLFCDFHPENKTKKTMDIFGVTVNFPNNL